MWIICSEAGALPERSTTIPKGSRDQVISKRGPWIEYVFSRGTYGPGENIVWSQNYECCVECGTTQSPYMARGMCNPCYQRQYRNNNPDRVKEGKRRCYAKNNEFYKQRHARARDLTHFDGQRDAALSRDNYRCTVCGSTDKLVVHHIDCSGRGATEHNNHLSNLQTLCKACHLAAHREQHMQIKRSKRKLQPQLLQSGRWSRGYDSCVDCGTIYSKHISHGLCGPCYARRFKMK